MHIQFWWGIIKERDYVEDLGIVGKVLLNSILKK
jgi:hypothetical protein